MCQNYITGHSGKESQHEGNDKTSECRAIDITMEQRAFQVPDTAASEKGDRANNSVAAQQCCTLYKHVFVQVR